VITHDEARMTFTEHLGELRLRIIRSGIAVLIGFVICYVLSDSVFKVVSRPLTPLKTAGLITDTQAPPETPPGDVANTPENAKRSPPQWTVLNPLEPFLVKLKLAGYAGILLAFPFILYQLCAFIFPGLMPQERKLARYLIFGCGGFAMFGVVVAYFAVFPLVLPYLMTWVPENVTFQLRMNETVSMIILGLVGFALAFQFPMVTLVLVYLGLLTPETLKHYRRLAIIGMAAGSALLTPPDPISMTVMLIPLAAMYEMSIWMSYLVIRRKKETEESS